MDKDLSFAEDLELKLDGKRPIRRENPKKGQSRWYYVDPRERDEDFTLLSQMKTIDVPSPNTPNPALQQVMFEDAENNPDKYYIWRTVGDDKVRDSHAEREGCIFSWDDAPEGGHPGEDYNCRCIAEPYVPRKDSQIDYTKFGTDISKKLIDNMLDDKRFQRAMKRVRKNEGGYSNDPLDNGLETKFGISKRWYPNEDIKNITRERADAILYRDFWLANGIYKLPDILVEEVFDKAVNTGLVNSIRRLHNVLGIAPGTIIGEKTLSLLKQQSDLTDVLNRFKDETRSYYYNLTEKQPSQKKYLKGWLKR